MAGINKVILVGNLGRDPEIRYSQQGTAVVNFTLATNEQWIDRNSGEKKERTEWHRIVIFGKMAETCEKYLSKGRQVYVEGKLQTRNYEKEGKTHYITEVVANTVQFLGTRQDGGDFQGQGSDTGASQGGFSGRTEPGQTGGFKDTAPEGEDDIPF